MISQEQIRMSGVPLYGLVLAGGISSRMQIDKGQIEWHGKPQRYYMADMLKEFCNEVFISCREEQSAEIINDGYSVITDKYQGLGPYGALLSAFLHNVETAWLVIACDLPLLNKETIRYLIDNRKTDSMATTFMSPHDNLPEPLVTIWEPRSYTNLLWNVEAGKHCPRKVLINSDTHIINAPDSNALINANTPSDAGRVNEIIQKNKINERRVATI